jgi:hypothetical protein
MPQSPLVRKGELGNMRQLRLILAVLGASAMLSACAAEKPRLATVNTNPSPYASGKIHTEPLYYNGKTYQVRMQHRVSDGVFLVNVSAPGRRLGTTSGDGQIVSEVGRNAVNHFACPDSQRARVQPGSARPAANQGWDMRVTC